METPAQPAPGIKGEPEIGRGDDRRWRIYGLLAYLLIVAAALGGPLLETLKYVASSDVHSYVLLVPFVTAYLIYIRRHELPRSFSSAWVWGMAFLVAGTAVAIASRNLQSDLPTLINLAFVCFVIAGIFLFLGKEWARAATFPLFFLIFAVPLPEAAVNFLENASKVASADVANWFLLISGTPFLRDGNVFQLPGMTIEVAKECSGIRSSLVLVITSLLAANLFLRTPYPRAVLVASVIPLGLLRNGFRILVVGLLCVYLGPQMIDSPIHRRGGPIFFALSLIPLFVLLWLLRRGEQRRSEASAKIDLPRSH